MFLGNEVCSIRLPTYQESPLPLSDSLNVPSYLPIRINRLLQTIKLILSISNTSENRSNLSVIPIANTNPRCKVIEKLKNIISILVPF